MPPRKPQTPAKKATAKKAAPAKKAPTKKAPASAATKAAPDKPAVKKVPAKPAAKKVPAKPAAKKVPAKPAATRPAVRPPDQPVVLQPSRSRAVPAPAVHAPLPRALRDLYATYHQSLAPIWDPASGLTVDIKVPASVSLYPKRQRCKGCNRSLGAEAILRMFCTYACAGLPEPDLNPATAPRPCKRAARTDEPGEWAFKQRFTTPETAAHYLRSGTTLYRCANCFFLHIGNVSTPPTPGIPDAPTSGRGPFEDAVLAVLHGRGTTGQPTPAQVASVKRDVRAVFDALRKHAGPGGAVRLPTIR